MQNNITVCSDKFELGGAVFSQELTNALFKNLFLTIADSVNSYPKANIAHIKGFCTGHEEDYLKINFVSYSGGVSFSGELRNETDKAGLTLNVIAMCIPHEDLKEIIHEAIRKIERFCTVKIVPKKERSPVLLLN